MIGTHDRALKKRPYTFDGVGVDISPHPFVSVVVDRLMPRIFIGDSPVSRPVVSVDNLRLVLRHVTNKAVESFPVVSISDLEPYVSATLNGSHDHRLTLAAPTSNTPTLAADVSLVNLNDSRELRLGSVAYSSTDTVPDIPSRLIARPKRSLKLLGGDPLLGLGHQVDRQKPLPQGKGGDAVLVSYCSLLCRS